MSAIKLERCIVHKHIPTSLNKGQIMKNTTPSVGDIIDAQCTKCQKVTNHVIVAMVSITPAKVQCNTCNGIHRYRQPGSIRKGTKRTKVSPVAKQEEWAELQPAMSTENAKDYAMDREYRVGTVIRHPNFGLGLVQRVVGNRKMEVLFEDGKKTMRCK
jgi:hypothetical protein